MIKNKVLGLIGLCTKAGELVFGTDACSDMIERNKIRLVLVAEDAAERTKKNFQILCERAKVPIYYFATGDEISKAIGKANKVVIGIKNKSFADQIAKLINGGEIIG